ncbi:MAG: glycosyltransferase family 4 protein [Pyrinomonadaceae bacterium]
MLGRNPGYVTTQGHILADLLSDKGYSVISASSMVNRVLRLLDIVGTIIRNRKKIDILILEVYSGMNFLVADIVGYMSRFFGFPTIFVLHGGNLPEFAKRHPRWTKRVLARANELVAPSRFLARELQDLGLPIAVIRNVVDLSDYQFKLRSGVKPKLMWMRAFHGIYNPCMAVNVFQSIRRKYPLARLVMAGIDKGLEPEIKKMVDEMGLQDSVRFPGFLDQKAKAQEFSNADIFLNTNHIDNMPVAVLEAGAMGLPVVATCVGGIPDLIQNGENGLLVPDGDVEGMSNAVESLLENSELAERLSIKGRKMAEQSSWEIVRTEWEELFDNILRGKKKSGFVNLPISRYTNS